MAHRKPTGRPTGRPRGPMTPHALARLRRKQAPQRIAKLIEAIPIDCTAFGGQVVTVHRAPVVPHRPWEDEAASWNQCMD
jgi:hypothetical protein